MQSLFLALSLAIRKILRNFVAEMKKKGAFSLIIIALLLPFVLWAVCGMDKNRDVYVLRLDTVRAVKKVEFHFQNEGGSLLSSVLPNAKNDKFVIDDFHVRTIPIGHYQYLFFSQPPGHRPIRNIIYYSHITY